MALAFAHHQIINPAFATRIAQLLAARKGKIFGRRLTVEQYDRLVAYAAGPRVSDYAEKLLIVTIAVWTDLLEPPALVPMRVVAKEMTLAQLFQAAAARIGIPLQCLIFLDPVSNALYPNAYILTSACRLYHCLVDLSVT